MRRVASASTSITLLLIISIAVSAVNPLDDDAGSGSDAGDVSSVATPIQVPGSYSGRLTPAIDGFDYYAFEGSEGDVLRFWYDSGGAVNALLYPPEQLPTENVYFGEPYQAWFEGSEQVALLDREGIWILGFDSAVMAEYRFAISTAPGLQGESLLLSEPARTAEVAYGREGANMVVFLKAPINATRPETSAVFFEYEEGGHGAGGALVITSSSLGTSVHTAPAPIPGVALPFQVHLAVNNGWGQVTLAPQGSGWMRAVAYHTDPAAELRMSVIGSPLLKFGTEPGEKLVEVNTENAESSFQVVTPVLAAHAEHTTALDVYGKVVGLMMGNGWVRGPGGNVTTTDRETLTYWLFWPEPGPWAFNFAGHIDAALPNRPLLTAAFVPSLGIAP